MIRRRIIRGTGTNQYGDANSCVRSMDCYLLNQIVRLNKAVPLGLEQTTYKIFYHMVVPLGL